MVLDTLKKYKVTLFLTIVGITIFTLFFAFTIGLPSFTPADSPNNNTTSIETPTQAQNTPTPEPTPPHLTAYQNTTRDGLTLQRNYTFTLDNQDYHYKTKIHYKPSYSLYKEHTASTNNETRRYYEEYYTPDQGYRRPNDSVDPYKIETTLTTLNIDNELKIKPYLQIQPQKWTKTTPDTYELKTTLKNDPYNPQNGTLTITTTINNSQIEEIHITINPDKQSQQFGNKTTIHYTINEYHEPEFYWKPDDNDN